MKKYCFAVSVYLFCNVVFAQKLEIWKDKAMTPFYNKATQKIFYNKPDQKGIYKIYSSDLSGKNERRIFSELWKDNLQQFGEETDPSGKFVFCIIEKSEVAKEKDHQRKPIDAMPGYGAYSDIWFVGTDGKSAGKLYIPENNYDHAITHLAISGDGKKLAWTERVQRPKIFDLNKMAGVYIFKIAEISYEGGLPKLANIQTLNPGGRESAGELESFSPDGKFLYFYSTMDSRNMLNTFIYSLEISTGKTLKLTDDSFSQAPTATPDGKHIVYMSGREADIFPWNLQGADWWIMDTDGKNKKRLTFMNKKDHPQSYNQYRLAGTLTFIDDHTFIGGVMRKPFGLDGYLVKVSF